MQNKKTLINRTEIKQTISFCVSKLCILFLGNLFIAFNLLGQATPSLTNSLITVHPAFIPTNGTATIKIQLVDSSGNDLTTSGGTISFATPSSGSIGTVTDHNDGTYTATFTAPSSPGTIDITPRLTISGTPVNFAHSSQVIVAVSYTKANNNVNIADFSSWIGRQPSIGEIGWFDNTFGNSITSVGTGGVTRMLGLKVSTGTGLININNTTVSNYVQIYDGGIDMLQADRDLQIYSFAQHRSHSWFVPAGRTFSILGRFAQFTAIDAELSLYGGGTINLSNPSTYTGSTNPIRLGDFSEFDGTLNANNNRFTLIVPTGQTATIRNDKVVNAQNIGNNSTVTISDGASLRFKPQSNLHFNWSFAGLEGQDGVFSIYNDGTDTVFIGTTGNIGGQNGQNQLLQLGGKANGVIGRSLMSGGASVSLLKKGTGTWTLASTSNNYSGTTTILEGTLEITGVLGNSAYANSIINDGQFLMNSSTNHTLSGVISGSGSLRKMNAGILTLSANNTYEGSTRIDSGKLVITGALIGSTGEYDANIINNAEFEIQSNSNQIYSGSLSGSGTWIKNGSSKWTIKGGSHTLSGSLLINSGVLSLQSDLSSGKDVVIGTHAILSGEGTLPSTDIAGLHSPGNSAGLQIIDGDLTYEASSHIKWELFTNGIGTRGSDYDAVNVTGDLDFKGVTTLNLVFNASGSNVDWNNSFWDNPSLGTNGWKIFEVTGNIKNLSNLTIHIEDWEDGQSLSASSKTGLSVISFKLEQHGKDIYLSYEPLLLDISLSTLTAVPNALNINSTSQLTVQLKDQNGHNFPASGGTLTFTTTEGSIGTVTDNNNGTYTATFSSGSNAGTAIVTASLDGIALTQTEEISIVSSFLSGSQILDGTSGNTHINDVFNTDGDLTIEQGFFVDYLIVGGGGGGGNVSNTFVDAGGGGGGAGRFVEEPNKQLSAVDYSISVGAGGAVALSAGVNGSNGGNSEAFGQSAPGGGGGCGGNVSGNDGGSGGGGRRDSGGGAQAASPLSGFGNDGGSNMTGLAGDGAGGGGGAGSAGSAYSSSSGGDGGDGRQSSITGTNLWYAAGGGGGGAQNDPAGLGGNGIGGNGANDNNAATSGAANTGSGGGGGNNSRIGADGGSGVVIVRYKGFQNNPSIQASVTPSTILDDTYQLYQFTTVGSAQYFNLSDASPGAVLTRTVSGSGDFLYNGPGRLTFPVTQTYTGATTIQNGDLRVNGNLTSSSSVTVATSGTLSGSGILPNTEVQGTHSPGNSAGLQTVEGNLTYETGSVIHWELFDNVIGFRGSDYDAVDVTQNGNLTFQPNTSLQLVFNAPGSSVDWTDEFWKTSLTGGTNRWKIFELSGTGSISGASNLVLPSATTMLDINNVSLSSVFPHALGFRMVEEGNALYLEFINANVWTGAADSNDVTTSNWSLGRTPLPEEGVLFSSTAANDLEISTHQEYRFVDFNGSNKNLILGNFDLTIHRAIEGAERNSYVLTDGVGVLKRSIAVDATELFPVGNATYNPVSITNKSGTADIFSIKVRDEVLGNGLFGSQVTDPHVRVTWDIDKATANSGDGIDLEFQWDVRQEVGTPSDYTLNHHNGSEWEIAAGSSGSASGSGIKTMSHTGYTGSFSPFAIGGSEVIPLPVTLLEFTARAQAQTAVLIWITTEERNNAYFDVLRSVDGEQWEAIGRVAGAGSSYQNQYYEFVDKQPGEMNFYRLRQVDLDGTATLSNIRTVRFQGLETQPVGVSMYPTPSNGTLNLEIRGNNPAHITLYDLNGKVLHSQILNEPTQIRNLASGIYLLKVAIGDHVEVKKVVVSH